MATDQALQGLDNLEVGPSSLAASGRLARRAWQWSWPKLLAVVILGGIWQLFYLSNHNGDSAHGLVQSTPVILKSLWKQLVHGDLPQAIATTMQRAVVGYALSLLIGVIIGAAVSRIPVLRAAVGSIITAFQTMPSIAWVPFAIILFGASEAAILFVIVIGSAPSIANGLITGVDYTPPLLLRAGKVMGLRGVALYRYLILPASLPAFVAGMKQGWAFAWRSLMAAELVVAVVGASLGTLLSADQSTQDLTDAIGIIIVILVIGVVVDSLFAKADTAIRSRRGLLDPAVSA